MISKLELTELFIKEAGLSADVSAKEYLWTWWFNPISKTSYRLTTEGHIFLSEVLRLQSYKLKLTSDIKASAKNFLLLDKHLTSPFFIENKKSVIFYGEKDSIMVVLSGYNLQQYLENFER